MTMDSVGGICTASGNIDLHREMFNLKWSLKVSRRKSSNMVFSSW